MKKFVSAAVLSALFSHHIAFATQYDIECLNHKGKFSDCEVSIEDQKVDVKFDGKSNKDLNVTIPGDKITELSAGEYSRRRVGESIAGAVLFAPVALFALLSKKKLTHIGVEFTDEDGTPRSTLFQIKKKYSMALKTELKAISGKEITEDEPKK